MNATTLLERNARVQLVANPNVCHDDAEEMFACYGAHISTEHAGDVCIQAVDTAWLRDGLSTDEIAAKLVEADSDLTTEEAEALADKASGVWDCMVGIEDLLAAAAEAALAGYLDTTLERLREAQSAETEHGDDPSTSALVEQLLEPATAYRVYHAPEGSAPSFCGEFSSLVEAEAHAEKEPRGLASSLWDTARAAGHCGGLSAPDTDGEEDDEPESWHGSAGHHCVTRVRY